MAAAAPAEVLHLGEQIEGEVEGTADILFFRIGASVPLTPSGSKFDLEDPPRRPLAVSERFGLLFLAHSEGFLVAKTKDVIRLAKEIKGMVEVEKEKGVKEKAKRSSIEESSIVDVRIGKVSILALSKDSSILAATIGGEIRVFLVRSLLKKEQEPLFLRSLGDSGHVRDFQWCENKDKSFIALSTCDSLYDGNLDGRLDAVMDNVNAVDCSTDGNFFIVARKHTISILSVKFDELLQIPILSETLTSPGCNIIVDSVKWIHSGIIILGCTQLNDDGVEDGYLVQVINSKECGFKASSQLTVVSFSDPFHNIGDLLSSEGGPHLLACYLDRWGLALVANSKNMDDHVVLLELPGDHRREEAVALELEQEKFFLRIELQENGDENLILGLGVDKISLYEKLEYKDEEEITELSPYCIVLCLSSEGKLIMFHITRISDPCIPLQAPIEVPDDNIAAIAYHSHILPTVHDSLLAVSKLKHDERVVSADSLKQICNSSTTNTGTELKFSSDLCASTADQLANIPILRNEQGSIPTGLPPNFNNLQSGSLGLNSAIKLGFSDKNGTSLSSFVSSISTSGDTQERVVAQTHLAAAQSSAVNFPSGSKTSTSKESGVFPRVGQNVTFPDVNSSAAVRRELSVQENSFGVVNRTVPDNYRTFKAPETSGQELSRHFYSVNDMVKELDRLLLSIEQEGGFVDASTVHLKNLVFELEKGLEKLSKRSRVCKDAVAEVVGKVKSLQDKMVQISAWEGYMEGMVKQASNSEYWGIWNRQKLGPEFELKQQLILKESHTLRNQILELERHFNVLELKKFGESGVYKGRRAMHGSDSSRRIQMLHNTISSQLAAAEHLSECLSGQMASLKITSPAVKQQSITKELLESIGVENHVDSFESPDVKRSGFSPDSFKKISLSSPSTTRQYSRRNTSSAFKSSEPETARRRRDSLDRSWTSFEPQKTMVKRMSHQKAFRGSTGSCYEDSRIVTSLATQNKPCEDIASSLLKSSGNKVQDHTYLAGRDFEEKISKQMYDSQPSSVLKWARDLSEPPQVVESKSSKSPPIQVGQTSKFYPSSLVGLSQTTTGNVQNLTYASTGSTDKLNFEVASTENPDLLTRKAAPVSNITYNSQIKISTNSRSPSEVPETISPSTNSPVQVYDQISRPAIGGKDFHTCSGAVAMKASVHALESLGKVQPSPSMEEKNQGFQDNALRHTTQPTEMPVLPQVSKTAPVLSHVHSSSASLQSSSLSQSSSLLSLSSSALSSSPLFVSPGTQARGPSPLSNMASGGSSDISKSSNRKNETTTGTLLSSSSVASSQPLFSSSPFTFACQNLRSSNSFSSTLENATSNVSSSRTFVVSSTRDTTVSSAAVNNSSVTTTLNMSPAAPSFSSEKSSPIPSTESKPKEDIPDLGTQEDEMDEEAPETPAILSLGGLGSFGLGSGTTPSVPKPNPFGGSFVAPANTMPSSSPPFSLNIPPGELFKPASFSLPSFQPTQSSPAMNPSGVSGGFSGFGQPAQIGMGQQALGSVLGTFGQSRQLGGAQGIGFSSPGGFGGGGSPAPSAAIGGFTAAAAGGGGLGTSTGGGFAALASKSGGFAALATSAGGFAGAASAAATSAGGGFAGAASGGFGSGSRTGKPPVEVLMQMRK